MEVYNESINNLKNSYNLEDQIHFIDEYRGDLKYFKISNPNITVSCIDGILQDNYSKMIYDLYSNSKTINSIDYNALIESFKTKYSNEMLLEFKAKHSSLLNEIQKNFNIISKDFLKDMNIN